MFLISPCDFLLLLQCSLQIETYADHDGTDNIWLRCQNVLGTPPTTIRLIPSRLNKLCQYALHSSFLVKLRKAPHTTLFSNSRLEKLPPISKPLARFFLYHGYRPSAKEKKKEASSTDNVPDMGGKNTGNLIPPHRTTSFPMNPLHNDAVQGNAESWRHLKFSAKELNQGNALPRSTYN